MNNKVKIFKNFLSEEEKSLLNYWCLNNKDKDFFTDAKMGIPKTRMTTRFSDPNSFSFPEDAYVIQNKIINFLNIDNFVYPPFKDGIACGLGTEYGDIAEHVDPEWFPGTYTLHCNILTQKPLSGGNIIINDIKYDVDEGDLLCFDVSSQKHSVDSIVGQKERILWVFGFCVPKSFNIWK